MIGYIRLLLAAIVLLSHVDVRINGLNPGVVAVIIFYMLAGGVVTHLWQNILQDGQGKLLHFYKDRMLRIFPLYIYMALLTLLFIVVTGYGNPHFSPTAIISNILIIPLNYYMVFDNAILTEPKWWLIPQAWSLGAELQAYLLLPIVFIYKRIRLPIFIASFTVYMLANLGVINTDYFGYRLLPGILFIFILGGMIKEAQTSKKKITWLVVFFMALITMYALFAFNNAFQHVYTQETLIGLLIGIPLLTLAGQSTLELPFNKMAGSLSYGVFLSHFLVIWVLDYSQLIQKATTLYYIALIALAALIAHSGKTLVELKVDRIRTRLPTAIKRNKKLHKIKS